MFEHIVSRAILNGGVDDLNACLKSYGMRYRVRCVWMLRICKLTWNDFEIPTLHEPTKLVLFPRL
jgi:hypothetical protein